MRYRNMKLDNNGPLVSVVIPAYNVAEYINQTIASVREQSYKNWELIVVDDGSTDRTLEVIAESVKQIRQHVVVHHQENGGLSAARNSGVKLATGEYVYFLDSDDLLPQNALLRFVELSYQNALDVLSFSAVNFADDSYAMGDEESTKRRIEEYDEYYDRINNQICVFSGEDAFISMVNSNHFVPSAPLSFYRKTLVEKTPFYKGILFEDNLFMTQILLKARRVGIINEKLYKRRIRSGSIMHNDAHDYIRRFASHFVISEELRKMLGDCSNHVYEALESIYSRFVALSMDDYCKLLQRNQIDLLNLNQYELCRDSLVQYQVFYKTQLANMHVKSEELHAENMSLKQDNSFLEKETQRIKDSWTYKIGLVITALPRWAKHQITK